MRLFRGFLLFVMALGPINGCAHHRPLAASKTPDTSNVIRLMGRWSSAHACPVWPNLILTSAHVVDGPTGWIPYRYQDLKGQTGVISPNAVEKCSDLGWLDPKGKEFGWYVRADTEPKPGDTVWLLAYDWSSKSQTYKEKLIETRVIRVLAGILAMEGHGEPGSSGSCVFNSRGEVVAINAGAVHVAGDLAGRAVGIYGTWLDSCE